MKQFLCHDGSNKINDLALLFLRLTACIVIFPHGAQLLLGWFGGYGFSGTMTYFTEVEKMPYLIALLVILIEFFGALMLLVGMLTRLNAISMGIIFLGMVLKSHLEFGFFMNWFGHQKGEGFEYHILVIGMMLALASAGGGNWSIDAVWRRRRS